MKLSRDKKILLEVKASDISSEGSVCIPKSVTAIGDLAFTKQTALKKIIIPDHVTSIGKDAFYQCENLKSVTLSNSITKLNQGTFRECSSLESITIPDGVTEIDHEVFAQCSLLKVITIPSSVRTIETDCAFADCKILNVIIDSANEEDKKRITALLPCRPRNNLMQKGLESSLFSLIKNELDKILYVPHNHSLFHFFTGKASCLKNGIKTKIDALSPNVLTSINRFLADENPYYQQAKQAIAKIAFPRSQEGIASYKDQVIDIVDKYRSESQVDFAKATSLNVASKASPIKKISPI